MLLTKDHRPKELFVRSLGVRTVVWQVADEGGSGLSAVVEDPDIFRCGAVSCL
jgi:hypothetical protein